MSVIYIGTLGRYTTLCPFINFFVGEQIEFLFAGFSYYLSGGTYFAKTLSLILVELLSTKNNNSKEQKYIIFGKTWN